MFKYKIYLLFYIGVPSIMFLRFCLIFTIGQLSLGYENLAFNKATWQAKPYLPNSTFHSSNAVDGRKTDLSAWGGQCVISSSSQNTATWWVNLESVFSIHLLRIYYRTENTAWDTSNKYTSRFLGFYVYISNTTNRLDGHLCFHDTNYTRSTIPAVVDITCPVHGQYVIYYNERPQNSKYANQFSQYAYNELCEVEVFGCSAGYYGSNCSLSCPSNCYHGYCHIEAGDCQRCESGYQGQRCELKCDERYYGTNCLSQCGDCVNFEQCHHVNGSCLNGCDLGFYGEKCVQQCPLGQYGRNCESSCNVNCQYSDRCDSKSGACQGGCKTGRKGLKCEAECDSNMFGMNCSKQCGHCWDGSQCHHINGTCPLGCDPGYIGDTCTEACEAGMYGVGCKQKCSAFCSVSGICNHVTGTCKQGCKNGWIGLDCLEVKENVEDNLVLYIVVAALSVCVVVIVLLIIYIIHLRGNIRQIQTTNKYNKSKANSMNTTEENYDSIIRTSNTDYLELGVMSQQIPGN